MKKRWLRILLGLLVVGIWAAVIARAVHRPNGDAGPVAPPTTSMIVPRDPHGDTLSTAFHFARDPFLDGASVPSEHTPSIGSATTVAHKAAEPVPKALPPTQPWPVVVYHGTVRATGEPSTTVAFLTVEKRSILLKQGTESDGLRIVSLAADSLVLAWHGEVRGFARR